MRKVRRQSTHRDGYALTVLKSPRISKFRVRLTNDYPQGGIAGSDLILARVYGAVISKVGGVPAGASSSPVYIGEKLIGAVSQVINFDPKLIGITPIAAMRALASEPQGRFSAAKQVNADTSSILAVGNGFRTEPAKRAVACRLMGTVVTPSTVKVAVRSRAPTPGGPVGVALMTGDLKVGYVGTVTEIDGANVYAFGHPVLFAGSTSLPMTTADVLETAGGQYPAKVAVIGETVGAITQDRATGTLGVLNQPVKGMVQLLLTVNDMDRDYVERVVAQAVPLPTELPFLTYVAALETVTRAINRVGPGTAQWQWTIRLGEGEPITLSQEAYDPYDIAFAIAVSVFPLLEEPLSAGIGIDTVSLIATVTSENTMA